MDKPILTGTGFLRRFSVGAGKRQLGIELIDVGGAEQINMLVQLAAKPRDDQPLMRILVAPSNGPLFDGEIEVLPPEAPTPAEPEKPKGKKGRKGSKGKKASQQVEAA